jgi:hypothetical protein
MIAAMLGMLAAAAVQAAPMDGKLIRQFCEPLDIHHWTCKVAKGYPAQDNGVCEVTVISSTAVTGHFVDPSSTVMVVGYDSPCEAHVNNFGGSLLFADEGKGFGFKGYQPGVTGDACLAVPQAGGVDKLVCQTSYMGQGVLESGIEEVEITRDVSASYAAAVRMVATATSTAGAYGGDTVDCSSSEPMQMIMLSLPPQAASGTRVKVEADYADQAAVKKACNAKPRAQGTDGMAVPDGQALLKGHTPHGIFNLDLVSGTLVPEVIFPTR